MIIDCFASVDQHTQVDGLRIPLWEEASVAIRSSSPWKPKGLILALLSSAGNQAWQYEELSFLESYSARY